MTNTDVIQNANVAACGSDCQKAADYVASQLDAIFAAQDKVASLGAIDGVQARSGEFASSITFGQGKGTGPVGRA